MKEILGFLTTVICKLEEKHEELAEEANQLLHKVFNHIEEADRESN